MLEQGQTRIEDRADDILADPRIAQLFLGGGLEPDGMSERNAGRPDRREYQQSLAPALHEDAFAAAGMLGHYHLMDVDGPRPRRCSRLLAAARTAGFAGVNVTFPFKEAVIPLLDAVSTEAPRSAR